MDSLHKQQKQGKKQGQNHQDAPEESQSSQVDQLQVEKTLRILRKLKKIDKKGELSKFKSKNKSNNALFHQMSEFFHQKHRRKIQQRVKVVQARKALSKRKFESTVNAQSVPIITQDCLQVQSNSNQQDPLPSQQHDQTDLPHYKIQLSCHTCNKPYMQVHSFYGSLCPECAAFNWSKRTQRADMHGLTALVTGARIKIGYEIALRLLREGVTVYATSRFPKDTVLRYQKEPDYPQWNQRLFIIQCDFLCQSQVAALIAYIQQNVRKLDILINNAAQTIVRPKQFYTLEIKNEQLSLQGSPQVVSQALQVVDGRQMEQSFPSVYANTLVPLPGEIDTQHLDQFGQPTDKRSTNTWVQKIEDVSLLDCYTTQVVNSIVPFHLISQLKDKLKGSNPSWVINVSSMEGVFYRPGKQHHHPHTNMAKAALNMITRTSASEFASHGIYMNSVDTGWVTNENPYHIAKKMMEVHRFKCPLDCLDGAMRVLDPIYQGILAGNFPYGQFLKNYHASNW